MFHRWVQNLVAKLTTARYVLGLTRDPRVLLRLVRGFCRVNFLRRDQLRFVEVLVTLACNAQCWFCSNRNFSNRKTSITVEQYLDIIDQCAELDVPIVCLIGGETLLYKHLEPLLRRIRRRGMLAQISTNGTLLTEARIRQLSEWGLSIVTCSLLSLDERTHDEIMGIPGGFRTIMDAREHCRTHGIHYSLATVVSHQDFADGTFDRYVQFATTNRIPIFVNALMPTCSRDACDDLLSEQDVDTLNAVTRTNRFLSTHLTNNFFGFGCPAGNAYLGVNVTGEILPCFFFPVSMGNVHDTSLRAAWQRACASPLFSCRHKMCYAAVSREFVYEYLNPVFESGTFPIPIENHPRYDAEHGVLCDLSCADPGRAIGYRPDRPPGGSPELCELTVGRS